MKNSSKQPQRSNLKNLILPISFLLFSLLSFENKVFSFVLLSGPEEAKLQCTPDQPRVGFILTSESPTIEKKEEYMDGAYTQLSDAELWPILVNDAMRRWNLVPSSFVELFVDTTSPNVASFDESDRVHSIVIGASEFSSAALANPQVEDGWIVDCDIQVSNRSVEANDLLYTLVHELGHCLGLGHNHSNYGAIMGYSRDGKTAKLGADDVAGVSYLYPDPDVILESSSDNLGCGRIQKTKNSNKNFFSIGSWLFLLPLLCIGLRKLKLSRSNS